MTEISIAIDEISLLLGIAIGLGLPDLARQILSARMLKFGRRSEEDDLDR